MTREASKCLARESSGYNENSKQGTTGPSLGLGRTFRRKSMKKGKEAPGKEAARMRRGETAGTGRDPENRGGGGRALAAM
jgi:hypothetical protein